jgi:ElaB/YqjD/DUF883 family membrane-anchored ribosome-binding protein
MDDQATRRGARATADETIEQVTEEAKTMAGKAGEQMTWFGEQAGRAAEQVRQAAGQVRQAAVQRDTEELKRQAAAARGAIAEQGARAGEYLSQSVAQNPLTALLMAAAIGYGLAYLFHRGQS